MTAPVVAAAGVKPVVPPDQLKTPVFESVTLPVVPDADMPVPAMIDRTPVLPIVTLPVALDTEMPVLAMLDKTPVLATVTVPEPLVTEMPAPYPNVLRVYPEPLPISSWPLVGIVPNPVPPEVTGRTPEPVPVKVYRL